MAQSTPAPAAQGAVRNFNIPAQSLRSALSLFNRQSGMQVSQAAGAISADVTANAVSGSMTAQEALSRLLRGTGVSARFISGDAAVISAQTTGADAGVAADGSTVLNTILITGKMGRDAASGRGFQGTPDWVYETPAAVSVISREAIESRPPRNTGDLVRDTPGVYSSQDRQNPGFTANIRGWQDQGRVGVSVDGARQDFQQSGHGNTSYAYVDTELMRGVVVEKGPNTGTGGSGVIGGTINFRTLEVDDLISQDKQFGGRLNTTAGTNAYDFNGSLAIAARISDAVDFVAALSHKQVGEYDPGKNGEIHRSNNANSLIPLDPVQFSSQDQWSGLAKVTMRPIDDHEIKLSYLGYLSKFETSTGSGTTYIDENTIRNHLGSIDYTWKPDNPLWNVDAKLYRGVISNASFYPKRSTYCPCDVEYDYKTTGAHIQNTSEFFGEYVNAKLNYGVEFTRLVASNGSTDKSGKGVGAGWFDGPTPSGDRNLASGFVNASFMHDEWLTLILGGRYDHYNLKGSGSYAVYDLNSPTFTAMRDFDVDKSGGRFLPKATVSVKPADGLEIYGVYSQGWRPPSMMEALFSGTHIGSAPNTPFFAPNPNLDPETSQTWEIGVNYKKDGLFRADDSLRLKASYFHTAAKNYMILAGVRFPYTQLMESWGLPPLGTAAFVNLDNKTEFNGLEVSANYEIEQGYIGAAFSYIDNNLDEVKYNPWWMGRGDGHYDPSMESSLIGNSAVFQLYAPPKIKLTLDGGVRLLDEKLTIGGRATFVGKTDNAGNATVYEDVDAYQIYDLYGSYKFNESTTARFSVENLTDVAYVDAMGIVSQPAPGRTFSVSLQVKF